MEAAIEIIQKKEVTLSPITVDLPKWRAHSLEAEKLAEVIEISTDEENGMAVNTLSKIKSFGKEVESARTDNVKPVNDLVKYINGIFKPISESLEASERKIKDKMLTFAKEKERIRREEEAKRQREFEEAKRKAEQEYQEAQKKALEEAEKTGATPVVVEQTIVEPPKPLMVEKTVRSEAGAITIKKIWTGEIADKMEILKGIIAGNVSISAIDFKQSELNNFAKAKKVDGIFYGIKVYQKEDVNARSY